MFLFLFFFLGLITFSDASCKNCTGGYCGSDNICYTRLSYSHISSFSYVEGSTNVTSSTNILKLFDSSVSTSLFCPSSGCTLQLNFVSNYYIQFVEIYSNTKPFGVYLYAPNCTAGRSVSVGKLATITNSTFPVNEYVDAFCIEVTPSNTLNITEVYIYGLSSPPAPTGSPTLPPTPPTSSPTSGPTAVPSAHPTHTPTKHPTPDVCNIATVAQPCCGYYGSDTISREIDVITHSTDITNCTQTIVNKCCGELSYSDYNIYTTGGVTYYGCNSSVGYAGATNYLCDINYFDQSKFNYTFLSGTLKNFTYNSVTKIPTACYCYYKVDACKGSNEVVCGNSSIYKNITSNSKYNSSIPLYDVWWNSTYWLDYLSEHNKTYLTYKPCSEDSFIGEVSAILNYSNFKFEGDYCYCNYRIKYCEPLENYDLSETRYNQTIHQCCKGGDLTYTKDSFGYPKTWKCSNGTTDLCPDLFNKQYSYTTNLSLHYWYDVDKINYDCTCLYTVDKVSVPTTFPTNSPTHRPTKAPSMLPTAKPTTTTSAPTSANKSHAKKWNILNSFVVMFIVFNVIQIFVL